MEKNFFDIGIYTYSDVSKLLKFSTARIRGLLNGYKYPNKEPVPVLNKKTIIYDNKEYLSFFDLIEIRFFKYFLEKGVKRNDIIIAYKKAREDLKKEHPFATRFTTDGKHIFADNKEILLTLSSDQFELREILKKELLDGIDFENDLPKKWHPYGDLKNIVLDPKYKYGQPIIVPCNILTKTISDAYEAEDGNIKNVRRWYDIPEGLIEEAVEFEKRIAN